MNPQKKSTDVSKLYESVINDVLDKVKDDFSNYGVDDQIWHHFRESWKNKIIKSKCLDHKTPEPESGSQPSDNFVNVSSLGKSLLRKERAEQPQTSAADSPLLNGDDRQPNQSIGLMFEDMNQIRESGRQKSNLSVTFSPIVIQYSAPTAKKSAQNEVIQLDGGDDDTSDEDSYESEYRDEDMDDDSKDEIEAEMSSENTTANETKPDSPR